MFNFPYIRRELEAPILRGTLRNRAELILGPRQVGKSTMLDHLVQNQRFIKLTGEDEDDLSILADPKTFLTLTQQFPNVIIDEAQFVPNSGRVIKRLVDNNTTDSRIFVTGSSALDLGGHLKESAAGRFNSYNLWPLSLEELAEHSSWIEVKRQINDRMIYGCHPDVINDPAHAKEYLLDFTDSILYKDLFKLAEVRKPTDLTKLVTFLAANVGSEIRYGSIASELGIQNNAEIDASIDVQNRVANGIKSPAVLVPNGKKRKKRASARIVVPEPPSRQFDPVAERLEDLWIGFRQRIAKEFDEESWLLLRHGWSLLA